MKTIVLSREKDLHFIRKCSEIKDTVFIEELKEATPQLFASILGESNKMLVKQALLTIKSIATTFQKEVLFFIEPLLDLKGLFKPISSSNEDVSLTAVKTVETIILNIESTRVARKIIKQTISKNSKIRRITAHLAEVVLRTYSANTLDLLVPLYEEMISSFVLDSNIEVRKGARALFYSFKEKYPDKADSLFKGFDEGIKKSLKLPKKSNTIEAKTAKEYSKNIPNKMKFKINLKNHHESNKSLQEVKLSARRNPSGYRPASSSKTTKKTITKLKKGSRTPADKSKKQNRLANSVEIKVSAGKLLENKLKESIEMMKSKDYTTVLQGLEGISALFSEILANEDKIYKKLLGNLVKTHVDLLSLKKEGRETVLGNLVKMVFYLLNIIDKETLNTLILRCFRIISEDNASLHSSALSILELIEKKTNINAVYDIAVDSLPEANLKGVKHILSVIERKWDTDFTKDQQNLNRLFVQFAKTILKGNLNDYKYRIADISDKLFKKSEEQVKLALMFVKDYDTGVFVALSTLLEKQKPFIIERLVSNKQTATVSSSMTNFSDKKNRDLGGKEFYTFPFDYDSTDLEINKLLEQEELHSSVVGEEATFIGFFLEATKITHIHFETFFEIASKCLENTEILSKHVDLFYNRLVKIVTKTKETSLISMFEKVVIQLQHRTHSEVFLQIATKDIPNDIDSAPLKIIISSITQAVEKSDAEELTLMIPNFFDFLVNGLSHQLADIRRVSVEAIVELYFKVGEDFEIYLQEITHNQRNVISIFYNKKAKQVE